MTRPYLARQLVLVAITTVGLILLFYSGITADIANRLNLAQWLVIAAVMLISLVGFIHIPVSLLPASLAISPVKPSGILIPYRSVVSNHTLIAVNLGGAILPLLYSLLLLLAFPVPFWPFIAVIGIVTLASYILSRPIPGLGIGLPVFSTPVISALATYFLVNEHLVSTTYIAATIGVMLGADVFRLKDIKQLGASFVSIGGAGILDSIVLTGLIAVMLVLFF